MTDTPMHLEDLRAYAQGEIFLLSRAGEAFEGLVYNTSGFGPCPADEFAAIDTAQLAKDTGCDLVWKNPRRFWMMDTLTIDLAGEPRELGGLMFNCLADMQMPAGFDPQRDQSALAYRPMQIHRANTYTFLSGRPVFLLRSPDETTWVMQTFTDHVDHSLTESALPRLAERLTLPEGWTYKARTVDRDLTITTHGLAHIVSDNLANMYQGCVDGVNNFDPWE
ncbi:hypothetical protein [Streptomyces sp. NPDC020817]|uniref:hypothetical protein n=1 Tax=Streptomyces sp. NPDC020817 TaxID=3365095 RepID=UPI00378DEB6B